MKTSLISTRKNADTPLLKPEITTDKKLKLVD